MSSPALQQDRAALELHERLAVAAIVERCGARVASHVLGCGPRTLLMAIAGESLTAPIAAYLREALARQAS